MPTTPLIANKNHFISLEDAIVMTVRYRDHKNSILVTSAQDQNILPTCETFNRVAFDNILNNEDCVGVRCYYSMDSNSRIHMIVVGVDENNLDILPPENANLALDSNCLIIENAQRCPTECPPDSPLNS